ncbi:hypothetical protein [Nocardioides okcheonensis]|uniref:hypothetical protein n=1 Tax=Nocardioides okcheonensis TaxID=2894081 RepID=UPI001E624C0C|nr:hypothetical protein [Nocardioides okcheonensis]UFN43507.1 hypothetical protein LN652_15845 [Nocardioides okcheonensis]
MATKVRPRGPLPSRVYWRRRLVVLAVPLLLVVVLARVLTGSSDGSDGATGAARQAGAEVQAPPVGPTAGPTAQVPAGKKGQETVPPEPVLAEPSGPCSDADIVATPTLVSATGGADVPITINLRTLDAAACTWQVSPQTLTVTITSGDDFIWSTRQCPASITPQDVVVRQAVDTPVVVTWKGAKRSDDTCSGRTDWALPGFYHVETAALGGDGTDVQFELVAPQPGVVTETAQPQQQDGKGKKKRDGAPDVQGNPEG